MKKNIKTALTLLLAFLFLFSAVVTAFAEAEDEEQEETYAAEEENKEETGNEAEKEPGDEDEEEPGEESEGILYVINGISFEIDPAYWETEEDDEDFKVFSLRGQEENVYLIAGDSGLEFAGDLEEMKEDLAKDSSQVMEEMFPDGYDTCFTDYYELNGLNCLTCFYSHEDAMMEIVIAEEADGNYLSMVLVVREDRGGYAQPWRKAALSLSREGYGGDDTETDTEGLGGEGNFRGFFWGDDIAFVAEEEDAEAQGAGIGKNTITGLPVTAAGLDMTASFYFDDGLLVSGKYTYSADHEDEDAYVEDFEALKEALTIVYGEPEKDFVKTVVEDKKGAADDSLGAQVHAGLVELVAVWHAADTEIDLNTGYRGDGLVTTIGYYLEESGE